MRGLSQSRLDGTGYSPMEILWNARDVFVGNGGMVPKLERHLTSRSFEMCPSLRMRQGLAPIERLLSIFRQVGKRSVLFYFQRIFDEISHFERQRDAISLGPAAKPFIYRFFQDDVDARMGCGHGVLVSGFTREKSVPHVMDLDKVGVTCILSAHIERSLLHRGGFVSREDQAWPLLFSFPSRRRQIRATVMLSLCAFNEAFPGRALREQKSMTVALASSFPFPKPLSDKSRKGVRGTLDCVRRTNTF